MKYVVLPVCMGDEQQAIMTRALADARKVGCIRLWNNANAVPPVGMSDEQQAIMTRVLADVQIIFPIR